MGEKSLGLIKGTLDLLILKALSTGEKHGYAVSEWLEKVTDGRLLVEEGTLYPALHRLERRGLIAAEPAIRHHIDYRSPLLISCGRSCASCACGISASMHVASASN